MSDLAHQVIAAMGRKRYQVDRNPGELNIVYVEGMSLDGTPNDDEANKWNDLRLVIKFEGGEPKVVGEWLATTEPGRYYTDHPLSPLGAARIEFGQHKAWQVGMHHGSQVALVQTGGPVTVCRDLNKDGQRQGDRRETGEFGINQHWGYDNDEVDKASAGCLVGQSVDGHKRFMELVKSDPRYQADRQHVFVTTVLPASDVLAEGPVGLMVGQRDDLPPGSVDGSDAVRRLQRLLGFSEREQDGVFGAFTMEAVKRIQRRLGLPVTGDADEKTREALERDTARGVESQSQISTNDRLVDLLMQRIQRLENTLVADRSRRDDIPFRPPGEVTLFPPAAEITRFRPPGEIAIPNGPNDIGAWLERLTTLVGRLQTQGPTAITPSASPQTEQLRKALELLTAIIAPGSDGKPPALGQVNGALGVTLGNLLDGKKTAIGVGGTALTAILSQVPVASGLGQVLALVTPAAGLTPFTMPIFLAMTAWGVLGKFEKWSHGTAPPPKLSW
jgi:hypothetical protein